MTWINQWLMALMLKMATLFYVPQWWRKESCRRASELLYSLNARILRCTSPFLKKDSTHGTIKNLLELEGKRKINEKSSKVGVKCGKKHLKSWKLTCSNLDGFNLYRTLHTKPRRGLWAKAKKNPLLKEKHEKARLIFAKTYLDKPQSSWANVLWTN